MTRKQAIEFHQYEVTVSISIRRYVDRYSTDTLADVNLKEQVSADTDRRVFAEAQRIINEARGKASRAMNIRQEFEAGMRQLEAGTVDATVESEAGGFGELPFGGAETDHA